MNTPFDDPGQPPRFPEFRGKARQPQPGQANAIYFLPEESEAADYAPLNTAGFRSASDGSPANEEVLLRVVLAGLGPDLQPTTSKKEPIPVDRTPDALRRRLAAAGIPARFDKGSSLEDMAFPVEQGAIVFLLINAGELCNDPCLLDTGEANGIILMKAIGRDGQTDMIAACRLQMGEQLMQIDAQHLQRTWLQAGGWMLVSDLI